MCSWGSSISSPLLPRRAAPRRAEPSDGRGCSRRRVCQKEYSRRAEVLKPHFTPRPAAGSGWALGGPLHQDTLWRTGPVSVPPPQLGRSNAHLRRALRTPKQRCVRPGLRTGLSLTAASELSRRALGLRAAGPLDPLR